MEKNTPQLFYTPASAPCRSVLMVAAALRLKLNLKPLNLMDGDHLRPTFLRISPHHTVPTLVDNEFSMFESRAICIYLVEKYGKNDALYPKNAKTRATINQLIYFDMGTLFKRFYDYFLPAFQGQPQDPQKLEALKEAIGFLDIFLTEKKFAVGYRITIADLILLASVSTIDTVGVDLSSYKNVSNWYDNMKSTAPGWQENVQGLELIKGMMAKMSPPKEEVQPIQPIPEVIEPVQPIQPIPEIVEHIHPIQPLPEVIEPVQPIQPLPEIIEPVQPIQPLPEVIEPVQPIQPIPELIEPVQSITPLVEVEAPIQPIQPLAEVEPIQQFSPLIHVEPATTIVTEQVTTTQQFSPLIEVTSGSIQGTSETITEVSTTTTKEVTQSSESFTEIVTEVREIVTTTEQVSGITKVIQVESETKTEVVNGATEIVENGKYEGEEVKI